MTPTQDTSETIPLYLNFISEPIPNKIWSFVGGFLYNYPREKQLQKFVELFEDKDELLKFMANAWETGEAVFRLKDSRVVKFIGKYNRGYFFDITEQVQVQSQISDIVNAAKACLNNHVSLSDAVGVVERNIRFE